MDRLLGKSIFDCFPKSDKKFQDSIKSGKNNEYLTRTHTHVYDRISLNVSWNERFFRQICSNNKNNIFMFNDVSPKIVPFVR
jgi:hypothetical protein